MSRAVFLGLITSLVTVPAQLAWKYTTLLSGSTWFQNLGFPIPWIGAWKSLTVLGSPTYHFYPYFWGFVQNFLFWSVIAFVVIFMSVTIRSKMPLALLPAYVVGLAWARIQLEFQMAIAAKGSIVAFAQIDPYSYAQITAYFVMALLLFPVVITAVGRLDFRETFRLCCLGFPVILLPPVLDNYVFARPVVYNFFTASSQSGGINALNAIEVLSPGIKLEILLVATSAFVYLLHRTRSSLRSASAVLAAFLLFVLVSTPLVTARLNLSLSQPQLFAGYLILTYVLVIMSFSLAQPGLGGVIVKKTRLRGIHFPAMTLFGLFLVHPTILSMSIPEDMGIAVAGTFVVFLVWQTAVVFDDMFDRGHEAPPGYLAFGVLAAVMALLAAIPLGVVPWLLTFAAVYLAVDYPRLRRRHYLLSGVVIGFSSCTAFLFGAVLPIIDVSSSEPVASITLAILVMFSGASLLKDVTSVDADANSGISTVFTRFDANHVLLIVATLVAFGFAFPAVFFSSLAGRLLFLAAGTGVWFLIVFLKHRSYEPVLALYFIEGILVFFMKFVIELA
jgi:hypothetical protein